MVANAVASISGAIDTRIDIIETTLVKDLCPIHPVYYIPVNNLIIALQNIPVYPRKVLSEFNIEVFVF
jgi:hypothetical protein